MSTSKKIALLKEYVKKIEAIKNTFKAKFSIDDNVPFAQYPDNIYPNENSETVFYKADSYYHDPYIPAHSNIEISGSSEPSGIVGTWQNKNPFAQGLARSWNNGNYNLAYRNGGFAIYSTASGYDETYYAAKVLSTSENGNYENPKIWDNLKTDSDPTITKERNFSEIGYENGNVYVTLKAGVTYKFGIVINNAEGAGLYLSHYLYDPNNMYGDSLAYGYSDSSETINNHACTYVMSYTPTTSRVYRLQISGEAYGNVTVQQVCYPAPETWATPSDNPWDYTFQSQWGGGEITLSEIPVAEHQATKTWAGYQMYKNTTDDKTTYSFSNILTEGLAWERFAPNKGDVFSADATIKIEYIDDNVVYPANATVWTVIIPNDNYQMWINVGTAGGGNFIVWGDGEQTSVDSSGWSVSSGNWSANSRFSHTYSKAGQYTVQVIGNSVQRIRVFSNSGGSESASNSVVKELIKLGATLTDGTHMFNSCSGLTKIADTVQFPLGMGGTHRMFYQCSNLLYAPTSLRWQPSMNMDETFYNCSQLSVDITHWFDNLFIGGNSGKRVYQTFYNCKMIKGKVPADKLWLDGSWYCNGGTVSYTFRDCTSLSNYNEILSPWK
jgi:hypothetical protein